VLLVIAGIFQKVRCAAPFLGHPENTADINRDGATVRSAPGTVDNHHFAGEVKVPTVESCSGIQERAADGSKERRAYSIDVRAKPSARLAFSRIPRFVLGSLW
jgi:hypothetical protein